MKRPCNVERHLTGNVARSEISKIHSYECVSRKVVDRVIMMFIPRNMEQLTDRDMVVEELVLQFRK